MNLAQIRHEFIVRSGRYDLINDDETDNGAGFFIQSGARFLDRQARIKQALEGTSIGVAKDDGYFKFPECWLIKSVECMMQNGDWYKLTRLHDSKALAITKRVGVSPIFYVPQTTQFVPDLSKLPAEFQHASASAFRAMEATSGASMVELIPHPITAVTCRVVGNFYSSPLIDDDDENVWSKLFPDTLIKAALYQLETFYRNTEGMNDWLAAIQLDLVGAEQMEVLAETEGKDVMGL